MGAVRSVHRVSTVNGAGAGLEGAGLEGAGLEGAGLEGAGLEGAAGILAAASGILAAAAGCSLVAVVRDAHRDERARSLIGALLAARPDLIVVEMGLPFWHPPEGTSYLATYGASRASAHAAAELLGLAPSV